MKKNLVFLSFLLIGVSMLYAQSARKILYRADMGYYDEDYLPGAQRLVGHVKFSQDNVVGFCDSAYLYDADNFIIAFGNPVRISVGDSVFLYGKTATYNGNERQASMINKVKLENGSAYLLTDSLFYDLNIDCGYYNTGGVIYNDDDTMTSEIGRYYTRSDDAFLNNAVTLNSPNYTMTCDSLRYNASSKTAYFISPTTLLGEDNSIYTNGGFYNTQTDISSLNGNVRLINAEQSLFADSVFYDKKLQFGRAWNNVSYIDTVNNFILQGNYMEHYENGGTSVVTDSNLLTIIDNNNDSLFLHCDTLLFDIDTNKNISLIRAFNHVKFHHKDLQGACDSISYIAKDSLLTMYFSPVLWTDNYQMTADTIRFFAVDSVHSIVELASSGFIVGGIFNDSEFNQIKGLNITGYIVDKELNIVDIEGNAECVYYLQEEDSSLVGINTSITNRMHIILDSNKIHQIRYYDTPDGQIYPDEQLQDNERRLKGFEWLNSYRPHSTEDLFINPIVRNRRNDEDDR